MKNLLLLFTCSIISLVGFAQPTQTIRGKIVDKESKFPLVGVTALLMNNAAQPVGTVTDLDGTFRVANVAVGRQTLRFTLVGYKEILLNNIVVEAGRETVLNLEMEEAITELNTVVVRVKRSGEAANEMAMVSARQFSVEETERYAGSRGEPARMASNFAGVQGADDSRNDIVIRGNSPSGVLWRLEGVSIPNPNHFAISGTSGGPVSIINNKYLANSDFFTGAFPAEFGNTTAGVFDLKLRNGNNEKHEFGAQFGFLGTEATAEGPLSKNSKASYLVTGRYANLWLFNKAGIDIGTQAVPSYADGFARFNFPLKNGGNVALWGIGGTSTIDILVSEQEVSDRNIFGQNDRDQYFTSKMALGGITYNQPLNKSTFFKATLAVSNNIQDANHDFLFLRKDAAGNPLVQNQKYVIDSLRPILDYKFSDTKYSLATALNKKWGAKSTLKVGVNADMIRFTAFDDVRNLNETTNQLTPWRRRWNADAEGFIQLQPYIQFKHYLTQNVALNVGLSSFYSSINKNSYSPIEPRAGLSWELPNRQKITFATGLHSQGLPTYLYFYNPANTGTANAFPAKNVGLMKSWHFVAGYSKMLAENLRLLAEVYYQRLYDVPVEIQKSSFSILNSGAGFSRFFPNPLQNAGKGRNYGAELTLEKFFSNNYYFLVTASIFDAKYQGSDGIWRNTDFNGKYAFNALFSKEFTFKKRKSLNIGAKYTATGGRWYGPADITASRQSQEVIYADATRNSLQFSPYNRFDIKTEYKINRNRLTHTIAVDLVNVLGIQNLLSLSYVPQAPYVKQEYQLGFLPVFFYRINF
ncbi:TonB-dependent receptor [Runella salmonicolor]|uniref:TonB-dependent receptor n=1 Tax=Runella salmonicolor TaxID=2950278 RepID=A0ABT1FL56_9BACT|nr:TonB-dependent receptor [Runella salmonicolor]MCP1382479.1 TonB-dependent receptor [Runella salmonicolor]